MVSQSQFRGHNTFALSTVDNDKYNYRDCHYDYYYQSHLILTTQAGSRQVAILAVKHGTTVA